MPGLDQFGYKEQLRRVLTTGDLVIYGLIFMVPIAPFSVYGFVWDDAKGMVPLAYLVGLVGMVFTAMSYAAMSRAFPMAGSVYSYAQRGLSETAGFFSGWLILLDYILVPALLYLFSAIALQPMLPHVPEWLWLLGFVSFNAAVNLIGIEFTARANRYMLAIELVVLALFIVLGLVALYGGHGAGRLTLKPVYDPSVFSVATVAGATSIAVLSFLGFDGISTLSEENRGNQSAVGRATVLSLLLVGALFLLQTWIATDLARGMQFSAGLRHGRPGRGLAHPVRDGARSQIARGAGQSSSALSDAVHQYAGGGPGIAAGRGVFLQSGRRSDPDREFRGAHGLPAAAPVGDQSLLHPRTQWPMAGPPHLATAGISGNRLCAV